MTEQTIIKKVGQPFVDEPVYVYPKREHYNPLAMALQQALPSKPEQHTYTAMVTGVLAGVLLHIGAAPMVLAKPLVEMQEHAIRMLNAGAGNGSVKQPILVRYERVALRWMKPGSNGKLVPR